MIKSVPIYLAIFFSLLLGVAQAQHSDVDNFEKFDPIQIELLTEHSTIQSGGTFWTAIRLSLENNWHAYWKNPGDAGMAPTIEWKLPEGFKVNEVLWPTPKKFISNDIVTYGYENEAILLAELTVPEKATSHSTISAQIRWVVCDETSCLPGSTEVSVPIAINAPGSIPNIPQNQSVFSKARTQIPLETLKASAKKGNGFINLEIDTPEEISDVSFYPEKPDLIDPASEPVISQIGNETTTPHYRVSLREFPGVSTTQRLKGVLLLKAYPESNVFAYSIDLPVLPSSAADVVFETQIPNIAEEQYASSAPQYQGGFFFALLLAFAGGLLLNLMPCVLPVISFKILSFVKMAGQSRSLVFKHGLLFSLGVLASFWALAGVLLAMQAYGHAVGWGFQLQQPLFVAILASIILLFGLSLFGVFEMGTGIASWAGHAQATHRSSGLASSFFSGVLATAIATPCTGPFLGTAVGFAVTLPAALAMLIFTALALGMAFPYLLIAAFPKLLRFIPKPGKWMVTFKEITGFIMLATVLWLLWVFGAQTGIFSTIVLLAGFLFMAIGCWIYGKWGTLVQKKAIRTVAYCFAALFLSLGAYSVYFASDGVTPDVESDGVIAMADLPRSRNEWHHFSPEKVEELRKQGIPVFIDFTAKWCLICQANHLVLSTDTISKKFEELGVVRMKADWTKSNPVVTQELKKHGRNSVPLYLLYRGSQKDPVAILPQVLTTEIVLQYLDKLKSTDETASM